MCQALSVKLHAFLEVPLGVLHEGSLQLPGGSLQSFLDVPWRFPAGWARAPIRLPLLGDPPGPGFYTRGVRQGMQYNSSRANDLKCFFCSTGDCAATRRDATRKVSAFIRSTTFRARILEGPEIFPTKASARSVHAQLRVQ